MGSVLRTGATVAAVSVASAVMLPTFAVTAGCGVNCNRNPDDEPTVYRGGISDVDGGFYETAPFEGPYIDFPPGRKLALEHGLGSRPREVNAYLAFEELPIPASDEPRDEDHSNVAIAAGNQVVIEAVTDEHVRVRNDTCSEVFIRVTASDPE